MGISSVGSAFKSMGSSGKMNAKSLLPRTDSQNPSDNKNIMEVL